MNLDQQLSQPLAPIRDDGFSVLLVRRLRAGERRMKIVMWSLLALGFAPVLLALQLVDTGIRLPSDMAQWLNSQLAYPLGVLLLFWVWKPRIFPR
jgi:hypothetical protein